MNAGATSGEWPVRFSRESVQTLFTLLTVFWWTGLALLPVHGLGAPLAIVAVVLFYIQLYRHWLLLQGHGARTTPGRAVGFSFIPFFCFYWWFVAYAGLATDHNRRMEQAGIDGARVSRGLGIAICVLDILSWTVGLFWPVGLALLVPSSIVAYIFALQQKNGMLALMECRESGQRAKPGAR